MARQRFIHPDLWNDKKLAKLNYVERLFFIGCFSNADDEGRMIGDPAYLRSIIFKYDDLTIEQVKAIRDKVLTVNNNLLLYQVDDEEYLAFLKWNEYQRPKYPTPSKIPGIPETFLQSSGNVPGEWRESFLYGLGRDGLGLDLGIDRDGLGKTPLPETIEITENERAILKELKSVSGYKFNYSTELNFIRKLIVDYPKLDTLFQIKKWCAGKIDKPLDKKSKPHSQLTNWFGMAEKWRKEKETNGSNNRISSGNLKGTDQTSSGKFAEYDRI